MPLSPWFTTAQPGSQLYAIHEVLRDWFDALQDGTAHYRMPDPSYKRPEGCEPWTNGRIATMLLDIDEYVAAPAQRNYAKANYGIVADAGPGYMRLEHAQRIALAQDLERAILAHPEPDRPYPVPVPPTAAPAPTAVSDEGVSFAY